MCLLINILNLKNYTNTLICIDLKKIDNIRFQFQCNLFLCVKIQYHKY